ncbi:MAG: transposase family protein [bacterium]|nr:transposase family protein [bacterium]
MPGFKRSLDYRKYVYDLYLHLKDDPSLLESSPPPLQRELYLLQDITKNDLSLSDLEKKYLLKREVISSWARYLQSKGISFEMPFVRKHYLSADLEQEALAYLQDPTISVKEIADTLSCSYTTLHRLYHAHADMLPERKSRSFSSSPPEIKGKKNNLRDEAILEDAETSRFTLNEMGQKDGRNLSKQRVSQILQRYYFEDYRKRRSTYKRALNMEYKNLLDVLQQHYFDRLIEENGLNHALAWRCKEVYGWGKKYSLETLEKLIAARRAGEGYYRCVKLGGIAETQKESMKNVSPVARILDRALCDIVLDIHQRNFAEGRSLSSEEEERLKKMWNTGVSPTEIQETLGLVSPASYYARKFGLGKRHSSINYSLLDTLISEGKKSKEMAEFGFSGRTIQRRKRKLRLTKEKNGSCT